MPHSYQEQFSHLLFDPTAEAPDYVHNHNHAYAPKRFAVYRNNVVVSLINALSEGFPLCQNIVGEEFFRFMARQYIEFNPPQSPLLYLYGENFAKFIEDFMPARSVPYLADMARLEYQKRLAYFAADERILPHEEIAQIPFDVLSQSQIRFESSFSALSSCFPLYDIMMRQSEKDFPLSSSGQDVIIFRQNGVVKVECAPRGFAILFQKTQDENLEAGLTAISEGHNLDEVPQMLGFILTFITKIQGEAYEHYLKTAHTRRGEYLSE